MLRTLKMLLILERSNKSNYYILLLVSALIIGFMVYATSEKISNPLVEITEEYQSVSSALNRFQGAAVNVQGDGTNLYGNILRQRQAISIKLAGLTTDKEDMFYSGAIKGLDERDQSYPRDGFEKVADLIPTKMHSDRERLLITTLQENDIHYKQEPLSYLPFLLTLFSFIGSAWFVFLSIYTGSIMIGDFSHTSIVKGYPVRFEQYVIAKSMTKFVMILGFIALIFIISLPLIPWKGLGNYSYPVVIYSGHLVALNIMEYIGLCILCMIVIMVFTLLLSIILNVLLKNVYLTLFVQMILYFLPVLFPQLISLLPFNPFNFLNFNMIMEGGSLELKNPVDVTFIDGFIVLFISIAVMVVAIKSFLSTGKLKRV